MIKIASALSILALLGFSIPSDHPSLSIRVEGISEIEGNLGILLFNSEDGYPETGEKALKSYTIKVESNTMSIDLGKFPKGTYAITLMHDKNSNGVMDKTMFGIPKEPFGFTKIVEVPFGTPSFDETSIQLSQNTTAKIKLLQI